MADGPISSLTPLTGAGVSVDDDSLPIVDASATQTKRITVQELAVAVVQSADVFTPSGTGSIAETVSAALQRFKFAIQFGTFAQAVTAAATGTLRINSSVSVAANTTVPATVTLRFERGGKLVPASGVTVTINGPIEAGLWQIFDESSGGTIAFAAGVVPTVYPEWWGAVGDASTDDAVPLQAAVRAYDVVSLPRKYKTTATISKTLTRQFRLVGSGVGITRVLKSGDADLFSLTNTATSDIQITVEGMTLVPLTDMSSGAALNFRDDSVIPSVIVRDVFVYCSGGFEFKYGIKAKNCYEARFDNVTMYGLDAANFIAWDLSCSAAATTPKWSNCSVYNAYIGANIVSSTNPGIEGVQFYGCDMVNVRTGVLYSNTVGATYFPPQIEWIGGHISATYRNFDIDTATQLVIGSGVFYNSGATGQFVRLQTCSDVNIQGNTFVNTGAGDCGISYATASGPINGGKICNNYFNLGATAACVTLDCTNTVNNLDITGNKRVGGAAMVQVSAGTLSNTTIIKDNTPLDPGDVSALISVSGTTLSLTGLRSNFVSVNAPGAPVTVTTLTSRRDSERVRIKCDSGNLTLQHNGTNPNGFILRGGANFTFGSGYIIELEKANGGYWTEVGRSTDGT